MKTEQDIKDWLHSLRQINFEGFGEMSVKLIKREIETLEGVLQ